MNTTSLITIQPFWL